MNDPEGELRGIKMNIRFRPETSGRGINQIPIRYALGIIPIAIGTTNDFSAPPLAVSEIIVSLIK